MKKECKTFEYFCDVCGSKIEGPPRICDLCGKEVCDYCMRYLCSKPVPTNQQTATANWTFQWPPYSSLYNEEMRICKGCADILKLSLHVSARKGTI